jgi:hypothetical protein
VDRLKVFTCYYVGEDEGGFALVTARDRGHASSLIAEMLNDYGLLEKNKKKCGALMVAINEAETHNEGVEVILDGNK